MLFNQLLKLEFPPISVFKLTFTKFNFAILKASVKSDIFFVEKNEYKRFSYLFSIIRNKTN
jgi:hypothetical protein